MYKQLLREGCCSFDQKQDSTQADFETTGKATLCCCMFVSHQELSQEFVDRTREATFPVKEVTSGEKRSYIQGGRHLVDLQLFCSTLSLVAKQHDIIGPGVPWTYRARDRTIMASKAASKKSMRAVNEKLICNTQGPKLQASLVCLHLVTLFMQLFRCYSYCKRRLLVAVEGWERG